MHGVESVHCRAHDGPRHSRGRSGGRARGRHGDRAMSRLRNVGEALASMDQPRITVGEASALRLGSRALAEVAQALARSGRTDLAEESARSAVALDDLYERAVVVLERGKQAEGVER